MNATVWGSNGVQRWSVHTFEGWDAASRAKALAKSLGGLDNGLMFKSIINPKDRAEVLALGLVEPMGWDDWGRLEGNAV